MLPTNNHEVKLRKVIYHQLIYLWAEKYIKNNLVHHLIVIAKYWFSRMNHMMDFVSDPKHLLQHLSICGSSRLSINDVYARIAGRNSLRSKKQLIRSSSDFEIQQPFQVQQLVFLHVEMDKKGVVLLQAVNFDACSTFSVSIRSLNGESNMSDCPSRRLSLSRASQVGIRNALLQFCHYLNTLEQPDLVLVTYCPSPARSHSVLLLRALHVNGLLDRLEKKVLGFMPMHHLLKKLQPSRKHFAFERMQRACLQPPYPSRPLGCLQLFRKKILPAADSGRIDLKYRSRTFNSEVVMMEIN